MGEYLEAIARVWLARRERARKARKWHNRCWTLMP